MLVLSRKANERIFIAPDIAITIVEVRGDKVRLGIDAPSNIAIHREEVWIAIEREKLAARQAAYEAQAPEGAIVNRTNVLDAKSPID